MGEVGRAKKKIASHVTPRMQQNWWSLEEEIYAFSIFRSYQPLVAQFGVDLERRSKRMGRQLPGLLPPRRPLRVRLRFMCVFLEVEARPAGVEDKPRGQPPFGGLEDVQLSGVLAQLQAYEERKEGPIVTRGPKTRGRIGALVRQTSPKPKPGFQRLVPSLPTASGKLR